jgi:hypothetical protein
MHRLRLLVAFLFSLPIASWAAQFCVDGSEALQEALSVAASNNESDDVRVVQGYYYLNQAVFSDAEPFSLDLSGGWDEQCIASNPDAALTTLEAFATGSAVLVFSNGTATSSIRGLTLAGGYLLFNRTANVTLSGVSILAGDGDGDGVNDDVDAFPDDPDEQFDTDGDGIGDNADADDDNDRMPDSYELNNGLNPLVDDAALDLDGDGYTNFEEFEQGTAPNDPQDAPVSSPSWLLLIPAILDK